MKRQVAQTLVLALVFHVVARAGFDPTGYSYTGRFVVAGYDDPEPLTNFPVLIKLGTNLTGFRYTQVRSANAADVRFVDSATNESNSEIELWNTNGTSFVWVQLPTLTNGARLRMYWGKVGLGVPAYRTNGATFSDGIFTAVWHMQTNYVTDSTSNRYNATYIPVPSAITTTNGVIGRALRFNGNVGSDNRIRTSTAIRVTNQTLSAWVWLEDEIRDGVVMTKEGQMFFWQQGSDLRFETAPWGGDTRWPINAAGGLRKWFYLAATQNGLDATLYVNGLQVATWTKSGAPTPGTEWFSIGGGWNRLFNGMLDECRVENRARSAAWIKACY